MTPVNTAVPVAQRVGHFSYAIRNIVVEAKRVEASGRRVRYMNIGNPPAFGFQPPAHLIEVVERALRNGENGYCASAGILPAREAVAEEYTNRGWTISPDRVLVTAGTSEAIELALSALVDPGTEVLVPMPTYPLYTALLAKLGASPRYYRTDPSQGWTPDLDHLERSVTAATRALVIIDPNNPTGASYSPAVRQRLIAFAERHGFPILADEVYGDLGYDGSVPPIGSLAPSAAIISFSSLSKGYAAPGWRTGWLAVAGTSRLDDALGAMRKLADGRLCSTTPTQFAIPAALRGDRAPQRALRDAMRERAAITTSMLEAMPGVSIVAPRAAFYAMPRVTLPPGKTDEDYVLELLRATGILVVYGSGFGMPAAEGYLRIVFLAAPDELRDIYRMMGEFTADYLR
ncbi:MAG: pyridoxal phosphate-dependent aminotransferase [Vicinamibacterales bacterium]